MNWLLPAPLRACSPRRSTAHVALALIRKHHSATALRGWPLAAALRGLRRDPLDLGVAEGPRDRRRGALLWFAASGRLAGQRRAVSVRPVGRRATGRRPGASGDASDRAGARRASPAGRTDADAGPRGLRRDPRDPHVSDGAAGGLRVPGRAVPHRPDPARRPPGDALLHDQLEPRRARLRGDLRQAPGPGVADSALDGPARLAACDPPCRGSVRLSRRRRPAGRAGVRRRRLHADDVDAAPRRVPRALAAGALPPLRQDRGGHRVPAGARARGAAPSAGPDRHRADARLDGRRALPGTDRRGASAGGRSVAGRVALLRLRARGDDRGRQGDARPDGRAGRAGAQRGVRGRRRGVAARRRCSGRGRRASPSSSPCAAPPRRARTACAWCAAARPRRHRATRACSKPRRAPQVEIPNLCRAGTCGTCRTRLVSGDVECTADVMDDEDRRGGYVFPCVAWAKSDCALEA